MAMLEDPGPASADEPGGCRDWRGHVIVCGIEPVTVQTVEQLLAAGASVVVIDDDDYSERQLVALQRLGVPIIHRGNRTADSLIEAGIDGAEAVVSIEATDLRTMETAMLARGLRPDIRVVAELDNPAIARAMEEVTGEASVLDVASLFAPSVVEACVKRRAHDIVVSGVEFVTVETVAPRDDSLRSLYGSLVPLGVVSDPAGDPVVCPGRDLRVTTGDRVTLLGTRPEMETAGLGPRVDAAAEIYRVRMRLRSRLWRLLGAVISTGPAVRAALGAAAVLTVISTLVLHFGYRQPGGLSLLDAWYFTVETIATVGFGDFSFAAQPPAMRIFGIVLIIAGTTIISTIFALLTNWLVSRRIAQSLGQADIPWMRGHVVMVGLGAVGMKVLEGLLERDRQVVVVERDESNRYLNQVRQRGVPLVLGDATLAQTLDSVNLTQAASVAIVTSSDMANIETGLAVRDRLGERWEEVPVVLRVFDRSLGVHLERSFGFRQVWSTLAISAPWFAGAALGMDVLYSFYVGNHPFLLARLRLSPGGGLEGLAMSELGANLRVIALGRGESAEDGRLEHPPRRDTRFAAGDEAYLAGPYEELMALLARERAGAPPPA